MISPPRNRRRSSHLPSQALRVRAGRRRRPVVELMESRTLLSIMVGTFDDVVDSGDGFTSLREAIAMADDNGVTDTIVLPHEIGGIEGTYALTLGELAIDDADPLTIQSDG